MNEPVYGMCEPGVIYLGWDAMTNPNIDTKEPAVPYIRVRAIPVLSVEEPLLEYDHDAAMADIIHSYGSRIELPHEE